MHLFAFYILLVFYTNFIYITKKKLLAWSSLLLGPSRLKIGSELSQARVRFVLGPKNTKGPSCLGSELSCYLGRHPSSVRPSSVRRPSTISKKNISEASGPILIKFNVNHNWVGGLMALGFGAECIKIVVSMATDRSHRLTMGKTKKIFFSKTTRPTALIFGM